MKRMFETISPEVVADWWSMRPCNARHSNAPIGTRTYFDEVEDRKYRVEPHIPDFADFPRWAGKTVLEVGCGIGTDTISFARAGADLTGVDISEQTVRLAKQRAEVCGFPDLRIYQWNAEQLTDLFNIGTYFDLVYSFGVIHHSPHPERILSQAALLTKPGSTLKIMVYHRHSWKVAWIMARYGIRHGFNVDKTVAAHSEAQTGCPITYSYSAAQARSMVENAGFRVTDVHADHIFPYRIRNYKRGELVKPWYWRLTPPRLFRRLERAFGWHLLITAVRP